MQNAFFDFRCDEKNEKWEQAKEKEGTLPRTKNEFVKGINYLKADFDIRRKCFKR